MIPTHPITTVKELLEWLQQFDENLELDITHDAGNGTGSSVTQESIYEDDGKLRIDIIG